MFFKPSQFLGACQNYWGTASSWKPLQLRAQGCLPAEVSSVSVHHVSLPGVFMWGLGERRSASCPFPLLQVDWQGKMFVKLASRE